MPEESFLSAKSLPGPFLQSNHHMTCALSLPIFCAYPPHPPTYMCVWQGREEAGKRGEKDPLLDCQAPLSPPGLNLQCPSL